MSHSASGKPSVLNNLSDLYPPPATSVSAPGEHMDAPHAGVHTARQLTNEAVMHESKFDDVNEVVYDPSDFIAQLTVNSTDDQRAAQNQAGSSGPPRMPSYQFDICPWPDDSFTPSADVLSGVEAMSRQSSVTSFSEVDYIDPFDHLDSPRLVERVEDMQRMISTQYNSSISSADIRASQRRQKQIENGKRPIVSKWLPEGPISNEHSKNSNLPLLRADEPGTKRKEAITKQSYVRPVHPKLRCSQCDEFPNGFRGEHELRRHYNRAHAQGRKVWICVDPHTETAEGWRPYYPLEKCKQCKQRKQYNVYFNAATHLRRAHFSPRKRDRIAGKAGGKHPPIDWLKATGFLIEIEVGPDADMPIDIGVNGEEYDDYDSQYPDSALEMHHDNLAANSIGFMPDHSIDLGSTYLTPRIDYEMQWSNNDHGQAPPMEFTRSAPPIISDHVVNINSEASVFMPARELGSEITTEMPTWQPCPSGFSTIEDGGVQGIERRDHEVDNISIVSGDPSVADCSEGLNECDGVGTVGPAFTDSGYRSLDNKEKTQMEVTHISDTDSVRSDNRDSGLTLEVKRRLASEFARELTDDLCLPNSGTTEAIAQIVSALPDLLQ